MVWEDTSLSAFIFIEFMMKNHNLILHTNIYPYVLYKQLVNKKKSCKSPVEDPPQFVIFKTNCTHYFEPSYTE